MPSATVVAEADVRVDDLFGGCRAKDFAAIAHLCTEVAVAPGRVLLREGQPGRQFLVVTAGRAKVEIGGTLLGWIDAGSFAGEMALLDSTSCVATVTAETPMHLWVFNTREFQALLDLNLPKVSHRMALTIGRRLRVADRRLAA